MRIDKIIIGLAISLIVILMLLVSTDRPTQAQDQGASPEISKKLDDVLKNQKEILQGLASIKEELEVIKIRVTR